jgi:galactokinase
VAAFFGKTALREIDAESVLARAAEIREATGDRALLRALHFFEENRRVDSMLLRLEEMNAAASPEGKQAAMGAFLGLVNQSGDSSWELLQNIYSPRNPEKQGLSLALALTKDFLSGAGACRVHGGGFAGTIQAYIPSGALDAYRSRMEACFGPGAVTAIRIRPVGAAELEFPAC